MKVLFKVMAIIGAVLAFGAIGTADFYLLELKQNYPDYIWVQLFIGVAMMMPILFAKGSDYDVHR